MILKQQVGITLIISIYILNIIFNLVPQELIIFLSLPFFIMAYGPYIYTKLHINKIFWFIGISISLNIGWIINVNNDPNISLLTVTLSLLFPGLLLMTRYKENYHIFFASSILKSPKKKIFIRNLLQIIFFTIGEEVLFRKVYFYYVNNNYLIFFIFNSLIFVYLHYFNRFSNNLYSIKDYFYQFILNFWLCFLYIFTDSIILCIISHFTYNSVLIVSSIINFKKNNILKENI